MVRSALSLSVAAVPEGLPMVATTTLALGVEEMRKLGILVRRLDAVETLASVQTVCFDKTGTLTLNRMSVTTIALGEGLYETRKGVIVDDDGVSGALGADKRLETLLTIACLCSDAEVEDEGGRRILHGSATESALVQVALDRGVNVANLRRQIPRLSVQHRSEAYRFMATTHATHNGVLIAVKGSPTEVLARCRRETLPDGRRRKLTAGRRAEIEALNTRMAMRTLRVLGFASGEASPQAGEANLDDLTWIGLMGLADPVRSGVQDLMRKLHTAGLRTVMLTGDQEATARAVAEEIGLNGSGAMRILDGSDLESLGQSDLSAVVQDADAFARVGPSQKLKIVHALQASGSAVVMVGDGVNDSPALRAANIGIALRQNGAAVAREVADIFLDTDDLNALVLAIERSRTIHTNIRKAIHYLLSTNSSEILIMLAATAAGSSAALSPVQLLWINLISDVLPGIGLALEPPEAGVMERPPRPADDAIVRRGDMRTLVREGAIMTAGALAAGTFGAARHGLNSPQARTMTFASLVAAQLLHALSCRSATKSVIGGSLPPNPALSTIMLGSAAAQSAALLVPGIRNILGVTPLGVVDMLVTAAGGVLPFAMAETWKLRQDSSRGKTSPLHFLRTVRPQREERARGDHPRINGSGQHVPSGT
jgi:Ca2+-transporting ATPase